MRKDLTIRKVRTGSGAIAVQLVRYVKRKCIIIRHIGSANTDDKLEILIQEARVIREQLCDQPSLFSVIQQKPILHAEHLTLKSVTHQFALNFLRNCAKICKLDFLDPLYQDLALMRIIEPASKLRTIDLLKRYFEVSYARRTLCRSLLKLIDYKDDIEEASLILQPFCIGKELI